MTNTEYALYLEARCPSCGGRGYAVSVCTLAGRPRCWRCDGRGWVYKRVESAMVEFVNMVNRAYTPTSCPGVGAGVQ